MANAFALWRATGILMPWVRLQTGFDRAGQIASSGRSAIAPDTGEFCTNNLFDKTQQMIKLEQDHDSIKLLHLNANIWPKA
jgi:hypothetical protein